jgi:hypothetical protein
MDMCELCGVKSCALLHPSHSAPHPSYLAPPSPAPKRLQVQSTGSLTEGWTWMEHTKKILRAAKSVIGGCWTMCMRIAIFFPTNNIFLWNTSQISCLLSIDCFNLLRLINHSSGKKSSVCVNHTLPWLHCKQSTLKRCIFIYGTT